MLGHGTQISMIIQGLSERCCRNLGIVNDERREAHTPHACNVGNMTAWVGKARLRFIQVRVAVHNTEWSLSMSAPEKGITHMQWVILGLITRCVTCRARWGGAPASTRHAHWSFTCVRRPEKWCEEFKVRVIQTPRYLEGLCGMQVWYSLCHPTMRAASAERVA